MTKAIALYLKYLENECGNESRIIVNILDKYTKKAQLALIMRIISQQMYNISEYFKDASDRFDEYESIVLDDF